MGLTLFERRHLPRYAPAGYASFSSISEEKRHLVQQVNTRIALEKGLQTCGVSSR